MIEYKITKVNKLLEVNNDMVHNYYYGVSYDDENFKEKLKEFFVYCNDTINDFNKIV